MKISHVCLITTSIFLLVCPGLSAKTFTVDSNVDGLDRDAKDGFCLTEKNQCTLRAAVQQANGFPGKDTIVVPAGIYLLNVDSTETAYLDDESLKGDLDILEDLEIIGPAASPTTTPVPAESNLAIIDGVQIDRVFDVRNGANLSLTRLVIQNGVARSSGGGGIYAHSGSSITQPRSLVLDNVLIRDNKTEFGLGGGVYSSSYIDVVATHTHFLRNTARSGGGIYVSDDLLLENCEIKNNSATQTGGGVRAAGSGDITTIINSTIDNNKASMHGGGLNTYSLVIAHSTVSNNSVPSDPNIPAGSMEGAGLYAFGSVGGIYAFNTVIENNHSAGNGGGAYLLSSAKSYINSVQVRNNKSENQGGGLHLRGLFQISASTINNNSAAEQGGGIYLFASNATINNSVVYNNTVQNNASQPALGAGLYVLSGTLSAINVTVSGNKALGITAQGGGLYLDHRQQGTTVLNSRADLDQVTLAFNEAAAGGNIASAELNQEGIRATNIVLAHAGGSNNCNTDIVTGNTDIRSENLSSDSSCGPEQAAWTVYTQPQIEKTLQVNSEGTLTHALLPGSAAINKSTSVFCQDLDQRYFVRDTSDGFCDIGAYEMTTVRIAAGTVQFDQDRGLGQQYTVNEASNSIDIGLTRTGGVDGQVSVDYVTRFGSATPDSDFTARSGTITFLDQENSAVVNMPIRNDYNYEQDEVFYIDLLNPSHGLALGAAATAEVVIQDGGRDSARQGRFKFTAGSAKAAENSGSAMVTVTRGTDNDDAVSVDYALKPVTFQPAATLKEDFISTDGTLHFAHGQSESAFIIELLDDDGYEGSEYLAIELSNPQGGGNIALDLSGTRYQLEITEDDPRPWNVGFNAVNNKEIQENDAGGKLKVNVLFILGETSEPVSVSYRVIGGTASLGSDYDMNIAPIVYDPVQSPGAGRFTLPITIKDDNEYEGDETIVLELYDLTGYAELDQYDQQVTLTILENDVAPPQHGQLTFEQSTYNVAETERTFTIPVKRNNGVEGAVTVDYAVQAGSSAERGVDYDLADGSLSFAVGVSTQNININIIDDTLREENETIILTLSGESGGASLGLSQTEITILKNDQPPPRPGVIAFAQSQASASESQFTNTIEVIRRDGSDTIATVKYAVTAGTATSDKMGSLIDRDFNEKSGVLTFHDGDTKATLTFIVSEDLDIEPDETINITLSEATSAVLGTPNTMTFTILDNDGPNSGRDSGRGGNNGGDGGGGGAAFLYWLAVMLFVSIMRKRVRFELNEVRR